MRSKLGIIALLAATAMPVFAQTPPAAPSTRVYGTVESFSGNKLVVKSSNGEDVTMAVPSDVKIVSIQLGKLSDIKQGDFVGSAAVEGPDGKLKAREVHIFPEVYARTRRWPPTDGTGREQLHDERHGNRCS